MNLYQFRTFCKLAFRLESVLSYIKLVFARIAVHFHLNKVHSFICKIQLYLIQIALTYDDNNIVSNMTLHVTKQEPQSVHFLNKYFFG